jgi:Zn-dependent peptidase ImmA (M78 family)
VFAQANTSSLHSSDRVDDARTAASSSEPQLALFDERDVARLSRKAHFAVRAALTYPPVNADKLARAQGIRFARTVTQPQAGYLFPLGPADPTGFGVHLRAGDSRQRQRFTLLHEAAHTMLDDFDGGIEYRCDDVALTPKEQLTNVIAGELLFPSRFFEPDLAYMGLSLATVETLATRYDASLEATAIQCVMKSAQPSAMFVLRAETSRLSGPERIRLKLGYVRGSERWDHAAVTDVVNGLTVREALEQRRATGLLATRRRNGRQKTLRIEAGRYPLTIGGRRRERVLALVAELSDEGDEYDF